MPQRPEHLPPGRPQGRAPALCAPLSTQPRLGHRLWVLVLPVGPSASQGLGHCEGLTTGPTAGASNAHPCSAAPARADRKCQGHPAHPAPSVDAGPQRAAGILTPSEDQLPEGPSLRCLVLEGSKEQVGGWGLGPPSWGEAVCREAWAQGHSPAARTSTSEHLLGWQVERNVPAGEKAQMWGMCREQTATDEQLRGKDTAGTKGAPEQQPHVQPRIDRRGRTSKTAERSTKAGPSGQQQKLPGKACTPDTRDREPRRSVSETPAPEVAVHPPRSSCTHLTPKGAKQDPRLPPQGPCVPGDGVTSCPGLLRALQRYIQERPGRPGTGGHPPARPPPHSTGRKGMAPAPQELQQGSPGDTERPEARGYDDGHQAGEVARTTRPPGGSREEQPTKAQPRTDTQKSKNGQWEAEGTSFQTWNRLGRWPGPRGKDITVLPSQRDLGLCTGRPNTGKWDNQIVRGRMGDSINSVSAATPGPVLEVLSSGCHLSEGRWAIPEDVSRGLEQESLESNILQNEVVFGPDSSHPFCTLQSPHGEYTDTLKRWLNGLLVQALQPRLGDGNSCSRPPPQLNLANKKPLVRLWRAWHLGRGFSAQRPRTVRSTKSGELRSDGDTERASPASVGGGRMVCNMSAGGAAPEVPRHAPGSHSVHHGTSSGNVSAHIGRSPVVQLLPEALESHEDKNQKYVQISGWTTQSGPCEEGLGQPELGAARGHSGSRGQGLQIRDGPEGREVNQESLLSSHSCTAAPGFSRVSPGHGTEARRKEPFLTGRALDTGAPPPQGSSPQVAGLGVGGNLGGSGHSLTFGVTYIQSWPTKTGGNQPPRGRRRHLKHKQAGQDEREMENLGPASPRPVVPRNLPQEQTGTRSGLREARAVGRHLPRRGLRLVCASQRKRGACARHREGAGVWEVTGGRKDGWEDLWGKQRDGGARERSRTEQRRGQDGPRSLGMRRRGNCKGRCSEGPPRHRALQVPWGGGTRKGSSREQAMSRGHCHPQRAMAKTARTSNREDWVHLGKKQSLRRGLAPVPGREGAGAASRGRPGGPVWEGRLTHPDDQRGRGRRPALPGLHLWRTREGAGEETHREPTPTCDRARPLFLGPHTRQRTGPAATTVATVPTSDHTPPFPVPLLGDLGHPASQHRGEGQKRGSLRSTIIAVPHQQPHIKRLRLTGQVLLLQARFGRSSSSSPAFREPTQLVTILWAQEAEEGMPAWAESPAARRPKSHEGNPPPPHLRASIPASSGFCKERAGAARWKTKQSSADPNTQLREMSKTLSSPSRDPAPLSGPRTLGEQLQPRRKSPGKDGSSKAQHYQNSQTRVPGARGAGGDGELPAFVRTRGASLPGVEPRVPKPPVGVGQVRSLLLGGQEGELGPLEGPTWAPRCWSLNKRGLGRVFSLGLTRTHVQLDTRRDRRRPGRWGAQVIAQAPAMRPELRKGQEPKEQSQAGGIEWLEPPGERKRTEKGSDREAGFVWDPSVGIFLLTCKKARARLYLRTWPAVPGRPGGGELA
ncbi:hypothetical protein Cadr_000002580 [Camelus dromedarius]|uniref:Uncharacterized protein n=1 Tax=Camelus dromedarius TaxID=9838 RepID=A0A5N4C2H0_CAMDR|nr:hypothetical protein Cadr_000002580 [Camelus dromedarius]